jgi:MOSC domain-containing protein YiiM
MKAAVRLNQNCAGVYCTIIKTGLVRVGDALFLD